MSLQRTSDHPRLLKTKQGGKLPSAKAKVTSTKACKIVKDGTIKGKPLSKAQQGMFGAICGKRGK